MGIEEILNEQNRQLQPTKDDIVRRLAELQNATNAAQREQTEEEIQRQAAKLAIAMDNQSAETEETA